MAARTLKYAILGLLNQKNMTGYDLMKEFEFTLNEFWYANHSQIYPELKKLETEGLITHEVEISGQVLEKKLYSITDTGREDFLGWLREDQPLEPTPKEVSRLKIFYSSALKPAERKAMFESQLAQHEERRLHLMENQKKFKKVPAKSSNEFGDYLVLLGAIRREEMLISWLQECLSLL